MKEMRSQVRFRVRAPVFFSWKEFSGVRRGEGRTRDISTGGMFVWTDCAVPSGIALEFEILLPRICRSETPLRIDGVGRVTRAESRPGSPHQCGFGICSDTFVLHDLEREIEFEEERDRAPRSHPGNGSTHNA